jgi:uncharacterized protein
MKYETTGFIRGDRILLDTHVPFQGKVKLVVIQEENILDITEILHFLKEKLADWNTKYFIDKIGLFGSYARGEAQTGSDIDIVISFNDHAKNLYHIKSEIRDIIETKFQKKVDIANLESIRSAFKEEILKEIIYVE